MNRAYNFSPGPCGLPDAVMERARDEFLSYRGCGASAMEISHRGAAFMEIYRRAESLLRELTGAGDDYAVLFLSGGATGAAASVPLNFLPDETCAAAYAITGYWSKRAATEAKKYCKVCIAADSGENYAELPQQFNVPDDAAYLHYADNETIHGVEFPRPPPSHAPLVADMSSNFLSRPLNISDYGLVYAGAQKNLGPAGITIIIARTPLIRPRPQTPLVWDYALQMQQDSMANTPPTFQIYMVMLVLEWLKEQGGAAEMEKRAAEKSRLVYECIDGGFYRGHAAPSCRSRMNIPFFLPDEKLTEEFLDGAEKNGMLGLNGHAVLGGCRASLYNAMPVAGARILAEYMRDFARRRG
ncbi:MAG: 3-phosphoserine/phosphohydroxythreonine transaminase [Betaproteobacteria bacterium]|nr:3-phosphoserine/phosphohydroxythreonine transaminase [Betaproteobacteria bacterium]